VFVGRQAELERLDAALGEAAAQRPGAVLVLGEAGVGKTRLLGEFGDRATGTGARLLQGWCVPVGDQCLAYGPISEAYGRLLASADRVEVDRRIGPLRGELVRLLPGVADGAASTAVVPQPSDRARLLELLLGSLRRLASATPVVLVIEDLQWADRSTLAALAFLVRSLRDERILLVASYRTDDVGRDHPLVPILDELDRTGRVERLELDALGETDLGHLLAGILGRAPEPALRSSIHGRSEGNPYFAEELLALGDGERALPPTLRQVLLARVGGLGEPTRRILRTASAAGSRFDARLVAAVEGLGEAATVASMREATVAHLLVPLDRPGEWFRFRHALLAEAIYEDLLPAERVRAHAALAKALEADAAAPAGLATAVQLARHWSEAGDRPRALMAAVRAGRVAVSARSFADARAQFERALELWDDVPAAEALAAVDRASLLEAAAEAAFHAGFAARATEHLRAAIALVDAVVDPVRRGLLCARLGAMLVPTDGAQLSRAAYAEALRLIPAHPESTARAQAMAGMARRHMLDGAWADALRTAVEAIRIARRIGAAEVEADELATLGGVQLGLGDAAAAATTLRRGRDMALRAEAIDAAARAWQNMASVLEGEACVQETRALGEWHERVGLDRGEGALRLAIEEQALYELGRWADADAALDRLEAMEPDVAMATYLRLFRAQLDVGRGRLAAAEETLGRLPPALTGPDHRATRLYRGRLDAEVALERGRRTEAREAIWRAFGEWSDLPLGTAVRHCAILSVGLRAEADLAAAARTAGRRRGIAPHAAAARPAVAPDEASDHGATLLTSARSLAAAMTGDRGVLWRRPRAVVALCEAEWARLEGVSNAACWDEAAEACAMAGQHYLVPYARLHQAAAALTVGAGARAVTPVMREAHAAADAMGAAPLITRFEALARRAGIDLVATGEASGTEGPSRAPQGAADPFGLTPRERDVLVLVARGRTDRQVAEALFITERTVGVHVSHILGKLRVARRTEAAAVAYGLHLVEPPRSAGEG
jgi:DNA-binding CsgD family transcriptional regulator/tetratricopeptide (TPR) repeat protein